jgi:hypothetical protein
VDNRYNKEYNLNGVIFYLDNYELNYEEACYLLVKVIEQAVRDYCQLEWSNIPYKKFYWETARDFIFEDDYFIQWGDSELNLGQICEILCYAKKSHIDIDWIRRKSEIRYKEEKIKRLKKQNQQKKKYKKLRVF